MANSADPGQMHLIWTNTVCSDLSVPILSVNRILIALLDITHVTKGRLNFLPLFYKTSLIFGLGYRKDTTIQSINVNYMLREGNAMLIQKEDKKEWII